MKTSAFVSIIAAGLVAAAAGMAAAQQPAPVATKFGFVNTDRLLSDSRSSQQAGKALEAEFQKREKEIAAGPKDQIERRKAAMMEDLSLRRQDALKQFIEKSNRMIRRVAEAEKIDVVFISAYYASKSVDITDKVIKEIDSGR